MITDDGDAEETGKQLDWLKVATKEGIMVVRKSGIDIQNRTIVKCMRVIAEP